MDTDTIGKCEAREQATRFDADDVGGGECVESATKWHVMTPSD